MTDQHPITPPPELQEQWKQEWLSVRPSLTSFHEWMLAKSARWGADQELEACCEHLKPLMSPRATIDYLRDARRQKPPSLKEQALAVLDPSKTYGSITQEEEYRISVAKADTIRRALEALPDD